MTTGKAVAWIVSSVFAALPLHAQQRPPEPKPPKVDVKAPEKEDAKIQQLPSTNAGISGQSPPEPPPPRPKGPQPGPKPKKAQAVTMDAAKLISSDTASVDSGNSKAALQKAAVK